MALRINTNVSALNAHKNMVKNDNQLSTSLERLSSGLRINKAADDASGMSIADSLRSQGMGLGQAIKNANDGINIVQTADAALEESINIVNTIKTKAIQAAQDGQTTESRAAIQADIDKLMEELDIIAKTTSFNGQKLLSGQFTDKKFQIGAYSGETVNISIASSESTKIGHVTTGIFSLEDDKPGTVEIAIYSTLQDKNFQLQATEIAFSNSREDSMAAVADSINKLSDVLGISAQADVTSTTISTIGEGTLSQFSINGIVMNGINVVKNDTDGALVKAINSKSPQHGIRATVDAGGYLTLTSTDGRAIEVKADDEGFSSVFKGQDLSTVGEIKLTQAGANDIVITNVDGGEVVTLTNKMDILKSDAFTMPASFEPGSKITKNSILGAGWTTSQDIVTNAVFTDNLVTTQDSKFAGGSVLGKDSIIQFQGIIYGDVTTSGTSSSTTAPSTLASYSTVSSGSVLAAGTQIGTGVQLEGESVIETTAVTTADNDIASGSILAAGTILASNIHLSGVSVTVEQTPPTTGNSTLASGSTLTPGTILAAQTAIVSGNVVIDATEKTTVDSTIGLGSYLEVGTMIGSATIVSGQDYKIHQTDELTATSSITSGSTLKAGTVLKAGSYVASGGTGITGLDGTTYSGVLTQDVTLLNDYPAGAGDYVNAAAGSTLANKNIMAKAGSIIAEDSSLKAGSKNNADVTLKAGSTLVDDMANISKEITLGKGSILGNTSIMRNGSQFYGRVELASDVNVTKEQVVGIGSTLEKTTTFIKAGSSIGGTITLDQDEEVAAGSQMQIERGSTLAQGSLITAGTYLTTDITADDGNVYKAGKTLENDITTAGINVLTDPLTLKQGSIIASGSTITANVGGNSAQAKMSESSTARLSDVDVLTQDNAQTAIAVADATLRDLDKVRADLGSVQNQLNSTIANISTTRVNVLSAESTIRDVDFADESGNFTKLQILAQAGTFAMSQANASSQNILSLLQ
ncbi:MAG: flagellar protein FlaB [Desulfobacter sp.]|nr:MAG: flagellar protein FlaB [Desulfobacter sp.]